MNTSFRIFQDQDKDVVESFMRALHEEDQEELPLIPEKLDTLFATLSDNPYVSLYVARENQKIIGYGILIFTFSLEFGGKHAEIDELYISPEFRGKGIGKSFIQFLEEKAKESGCTMMYLVATHKNKKAQELYEQLGYTKLPQYPYIKPL